MTLADWATTISGGLAVLGALGWIVRKYLSELKPNHGSSMRDSINDIHSTVQGISVDLARLEGKFEQHVMEGGRK